MMGCVLAIPPCVASKWDSHCYAIGYCLDESREAFERFGEWR